MKDPKREHVCKSPIWNWPGVTEQVCPGERFIAELSSEEPRPFLVSPPAHIRKQMKASPLARGGLGLRAVVGRSRTNLRFQPKLVFADRFPSFTTDQLLIHIFLLFLIVPFKLRAFRQLDPHTFDINCSVIFFPSEFKLISKDSQWICFLEICVENLHCNHICGKIN